MKHLWLLRHGSALIGSPDAARPLSAGGRDEAVGVGAGWGPAEPPDLVLCSSARRARETAELVARAWAARPDERIDEQLYLASPGTILRAIAAAEPERRRILVVGHNPGIGVLAAELAGDHGAAARDLRTGGFPPAALAAFELEIEDWREVDAPWARLVACTRP